MASQFPAFIGGDSISYRPLGPHPSFLPPFGYWPDTLLGSSVRTILPVGFFRIFQTDNERMIAQGLVSIAAWCFLLYGIDRWSARFAAYSATRLLLVSVVFVFGLSPQITSWNKIIYSESLSISLTVVLLSICMLIYSRNGASSKREIGLMSFLTFLVLTTKSSAFPLFLIFLGSILFLQFRNKIRMRRFSLVAIAVTLLLSFLYIQANNGYWYKYSWGRELVTVSYYASEDNPGASSFISILNADPAKPSCVPSISKPLTANQQMLWSLPFTFKKTCLQARVWAKDRWLILIAKWIASAPRDAVNTYGRGVISATRESPMFGEISPLPGPITELIFPQTDSSVWLPDTYNQGPDRQARLSFDPLALYLSGIVILLYTLRNRRKPKPPRIQSSQETLNTRNIKFLLSTLFGAGASVVLGVFIIPGPPREVYRIAVIPMSVMRLIAIVSVILLFDMYRSNSSSTRHSKID
jgi:hypothetical protein